MSGFRQLYEEERQLAELSLKIIDIREHLGLSQTDVARKANVTQQQLSKRENGVNCNIAPESMQCPQHQAGYRESQVVPFRS